MNDPEVTMNDAFPTSNLTACRSRLPLIAVPVEVSPAIAVNYRCPVMDAGYRLLDHWVGGKFRIPSSEFVIWDRAGTYRGL